MREKKNDHPVDDRAHAEEIRNHLLSVLRMLAREVVRRLANDQKQPDRDT
jgi:hypothetical protein